MINKDANGVHPDDRDALVLTAWGSRDTHKYSGKDYSGISWGEIIARASAPTATAKSAAQFIIPSTYRGPDGRTHDVQREKGSYPLLCLDLDEGNPSIEVIKEALTAIVGACEALIYSSSSATPEHRKWRVMVPLAHPLEGRAYKATQEAFFALMKEQGIIADPALKNTGQPVYLPNVPESNRSADGQPKLYCFEHIRGNRLDLRNSAIAKRREVIQAEADRVEQERKDRAAAHKIEKAKHIAAGGDDFEPIEHFNATHEISDLLGRYGFERGKGDDWRAPFQTSDSYALHDYRTHWVAVSSSYAKEGLGAAKRNGAAQFGDAFDLYAHFEHGGDKRAAVRSYSAEVNPKPTGNPKREIIALPPVMDAYRARARLQVEVAEGLRRDGVTLIEATLGLGKTTATIEALPALFDEADSKGINGAVVMAFPMHRLGQQVVADIEAAGKGRSVVQLYGVEAQDPNNPDEKVCKQLDAYRERTALHLDTNELCGACPFAGDCLYQKSIGAVADIYVVSHERLKAAKTPLQSNQTLLATVVDENPLNALISANRRPVPLAALMAAPTRMTRKGKQSQKLEQEADLLAFRKKLQDTIEAHGLGYLRLPDLSGWTSGDAKAAHKLEWGRKIEEEEHSEIAHNRTLTAAAGVFGEIQRSLDDGISENARLQIRHGENGLECVLSGLRPISEPYRTAPVLMLDATANPDVAALLAGEPLAHHVEIRAKENIIIEQDPNLSGAKSFFFAKGQPTGNVANAAYFAKAKAMAGKTAVISNKDTIGAMGLPAEIKTGHFNALRGLNEMEGAEHSIIIGRTLPPPEAIARMVGALWGTPCTGDLDHKGTAWRKVTDGETVWLEETKAATHSDERGEMILRLIRDAEVTQAIGRFRAVNRTNAPVRCIVISDAVLDYPVRLVDLRRTLQAHGTLGPMLDRGAVFLSPSQASKAYPDLYASKQAAAKVLDRISDWATFSIRGLYGKGCPVVELHTPRARNTTLAIIAPWVEDAAAEVKRHLPNTEVVTQPTAEIVNLSPVPISTPPPDVAPAEIVSLIDSPSWKRHRAKLDSMGRVALAPHRRVEAAGLPIGSRFSQVALVLHETQDKAQVARTLRLTAQQVDDALNGLYVIGLVDAHGALDGPLKVRKLVWAVGGHNPMTDAHAAQRRAPVRLMG